MQLHAWGCAALCQFGHVWDEVWAHILLPGSDGVVLLRREAKALDSQTRTKQHLESELQKLQSQVQARHQGLGLKLGQAPTQQDDEATQTEGWNVSQSGVADASHAKTRGGGREYEMDLDGELSLASQAEEWGATAITQELRHECYRLTRALGAYLESRYPSGSQGQGHPTRPCASPESLPPSPPSHYDMMTLLEACHWLDWMAILAASSTGKNLRWAYRL
jgi:hypothetical protein